MVALLDTHDRIPSDGRSSALRPWQCSPCTAGGRAASLVGGGRPSGCWPLSSGCSARSARDAGGLACGPHPRGRTTHGSAAGRPGSVGPPRGGGVRGGGMAGCWQAGAKADAGPRTAPARLRSPLGCAWGDRPGSLGLTAPVSGGAPRRGARDRRPGAPGPPLRPGVGRLRLWPARVPACTRLRGGPWADRPTAAARWGPASGWAAPASSRMAATWRPTAPAGCGQAQGVVRQGAGVHAAAGWALGVAPTAGGLPGRGKWASRVRPVAVPRRFEGPPGSVAAQARPGLGAAPGCEPSVGPQRPREAFDGGAFRGTRRW